MTSLHYFVHLRNLQTFHDESSHSFCNEKIFRSNCWCSKSLGMQCFKANMHDKQRVYIHSALALDSQSRKEWFLINGKKEEAFIGEGNTATKDNCSKSRGSHSPNQPRTRVLIRGRLTFGSCLQLR